ncbi:MAG: hypothetical protein SVV88_10935 [Pseudomonadota bacterium]|nr:hypothetical protein [Pseudomonadota bacterium]
MIYNLDELLPADKKIIFMGDEYKLAGDMPTRYMLKLISLNDRLSNNPEDLGLNDEIIDLVVEILKLKNEVDEEKIKNNITLLQLSNLISIIFKVENVTDEVKKKQAEA